MKIPKAELFESAAKDKIGHDLERMWTVFENQHVWLLRYQIEDEKEVALSFALMKKGQRASFVSYVLLTITSTPRKCNDLLKETRISKDKLLDSDNLKARKEKHFW